LITTTDYEKMKLKELRRLARKRGIKGYYRMRKKDLVEALTSLSRVLTDENVKKITNLLEGNPRMSELRKIAKSMGLKLRRKMKKSEIINLIETELSDRLRKELGVGGRSYVGYREELRESVCEDIEERSVPHSYNEDRLKALPVNPNWIHVYWDFSSDTYSKVKSGKLKLLVHDVTYIIFDGKNAHRTFEFDVHPDMRKYYVEVPNPRANYIVELVIDRDGEYKVIMRSNVVETPPSCPGNLGREEWVELKSMRMEKIKMREPLVKSGRARVDSSEMVKKDG